MYVQAPFLIFLEVCEIFDDRDSSSESSSEEGENEEDEP
jgi:hypothetical protein